MNFPEKLAGIYLRINGFLLLPQFTIFTGKQHNHIDFIAFRPANSNEIVETEEEGPLILLTDDVLFGYIGELIGKDPKGTNIGAVVEVKGNKEISIPNQDKFNYAHNMFGNDTDAVRLSFSLQENMIFHHQDGLVISHYHVRNFILHRLEWMRDRIPRLRKLGSWNLSEESISDVLSMISIFLQ